MKHEYTVVYQKIEDGWSPRATADQRTQSRQQDFLKQARQQRSAASAGQQPQGTFKNEDEFQATLASARRTLKQNQNTEFNGTSSAGDAQQLTHKQQEAMRLDAQRRQSQAQYQAQQVRMRTQNANNTEFQQKTVDLSFASQRLQQNYAESVDWTNKQAGNGPGREEHDVQGQ